MDKEIRRANGVSVKRGTNTGVEKVTPLVIPQPNALLTAYDPETRGRLSFELDDEGKVAQMQISYPPDSS